MINKARLVSITQKVIRFNSENPPGNEWALAQFIEKDMKSIGLHVKRYTYAPKRPNIIATYKGTLPRKQAAQEALLISPHLDTVPIGRGWKYNPLGGEISKGRIYGRGATDDKGNLACCLEVLRSLQEDKIQLKRDVIMAATVDEETGSHYGIIPLLEKKILKSRGALILDSDEDNIIIAQKGLLHCRIKLYGKKAHGAYNWQGINAIEIASQIINKLKKHKFVFTSHKLLRPPTTNIGEIRGGDKVNMVADFCEFALDLRFLPGMKAQTILNYLRQIIKQEIRNFKIEIDSLQDPYEIDTKNPLVSTYLHCAKKLRCKAKLQGSEGATVITFFKRYKIPAIAVGYGASGTAHTTNEYVRVNSLVKGAKLLEEFIKEYDRSG